MLRVNWPNILSLSSQNTTIVTGWFCGTQVSTPIWPSVHRAVSDESWLSASLPQVMRWGLQTVYLLWHRNTILRLQSLFMSWTSLHGGIWLNGPIKNVRGLNLGLCRLMQIIVQKLKSLEYTSQIHIDEKYHMFSAASLPTDLRVDWYSGFIGLASYTRIAYGLHSYNRVVDWNCHKETYNFVFILHWQIWPKQTSLDELTGIPATISHCVKLI